MVRLLLAWAVLCSTTQALAQEPGKGVLSENALNTSSGIAQWLGTTLFILALIFLLAYFVRKTPIMRFAASRDMAVIGQLSLGPRERLVHVRVCEQNLLVAVCSSHISLICRLDADVRSGAEDRGAQQDFRHDLESFYAAAAGQGLQEHSQDMSRSAAAAREQAEVAKEHEHSH